VWLDMLECNHMPFNLLTDPFLPIFIRSGAARMIRFSELGQTEGDDAPVEFDWPRPDFNIASYEFSIGVIALALAMEGEAAWRELWNSPPSVAELEDALAPIIHAFNLDGDGPRFMQDFDELDGDANAIEALLIDTPGVNGQKKNADLLTHRERYAAIGLPAAGMALYAMQQFAPSGGAGNRTSMRGGGPLTTLIMPGARDDQPVALWHKILANLSVVPQEANIGAGLQKALPWLAKTLASDKVNGENMVHGQDERVHGLQACFGMPRRVRLVFSSETGVCPMTGINGPLVSGFVQKPWGMNYGFWVHPLTPYRRQKEDSDSYSVKPKSGRFGYRDWVSVTFGSEDGKLAQPSGNIRSAGGNRAQYLKSSTGSLPTLRLGGWAMNNMEAVTYLSADQPFYVAETPEMRLDLANLARALAKAGDCGHDVLRGALRRALFSDGAKVSLDAGVFSVARSRFYEETEGAFHELLAEALAQDKPPEIPDVGKRWIKAMQGVCAELFVELTPAPGADPKGAERIANAYGTLRNGFSGYGASGRALFGALELVPPKTGSSKEKKT
jgi:CRISPR system Cascade subunit CasA